jgi:hypothetical protein
MFLKDVNLNILEVLSVGDILSTEIQNREMMIRETKEELDKIIGEDKKDDRELSSDQLDDNNTIFDNEDYDAATEEERNENNSITTSTVARPDGGLLKL